MSWESNANNWMQQAMARDRVVEELNRRHKEQVERSTMVNDQAGKYQTVNLTEYVPDQYGAETGREFNPESECHHFGFVVKIVDPGCSFEIQIEERSGRVSRVTTTESPAEDVVKIEKAVIEALHRMIREMNL